MAAIQKYLSVYAVLFRNSLIREMSFKLNFLLWMVVESLWFVGQLVFIEVIFSKVERIGDWTKWQMVLLVGTHQIVSQFFQAFFYTNLVNLPELVRTGKFDFVLLQPLDGQFITSLRQFGLDSIVNALIGIAIVSYSLYRLHVMPGIGQVLLYLVTILLGVTIHYAIMFGLAVMRDKRSGAGFDECFEHSMAADWPPYARFGVDVTLLQNPLENRSEPVLQRKFLMHLSFLLRSKTIASIHSPPC